MSEETPRQADFESQEALIDIELDRKGRIVLSSGRKVKVGWLRPDTQDKIDELFVKYEKLKGEVSDKPNKDIIKFNKKTREYYAKNIAAIIINNYWGLKLFWWIKWRIIYHYWHINGNDYLAIIQEAKKKATETSYYVAMVFLMTMPDMWTTMTKKEAEAYLREAELARKPQS